MMLPITLASLPGTPLQQRLLQAITEECASDERVRAIVLFGSLARGTWDEFSDLDLAIVLADGQTIQLDDEIQRLTARFATTGETVACVDRDGAAAVDLMLLSLVGVSLQYHPLATTPPELGEHLLVLAGTLTVEAIQAASRAHVSGAAGTQGSGVDQFLRFAVEADIALQRGQFWRAVQCLQLMRNLALSAYALTHGGSRPFYFFQAHASPALQATLGATLPQHKLTSAQDALAAMLQLADDQLGELTNGLITLSEVQRTLIQRIRTRQADLRHNRPTHEPSQHRA